MHDTINNLTDAMHADEQTQSALAEATYNAREARRRLVDATFNAVAHGQLSVDVLTVNLTRVRRELAARNR